MRAALLATAALLAGPGAAAQTRAPTLARPPVIRPGPDLVAGMAKEGWPPAPDNAVQQAARCAGAQRYFMVEGDERLPDVMRALDRCWAKRRQSARDGITITRWSAPARDGGASTLKAVVIRSSGAFATIITGTALGPGD